MDQLPNSNSIIVNTTPSNFDEQFKAYIKTDEEKKKNKPTPQNTPKAPITKENISLKSSNPPSTAVYTFAISTQKHIDEVLSRTSNSITEICLTFSRETNEKNGPYDLKGLVRFENLEKLKIIPEDHWNGPIQLMIPTDVIGRISFLDSDKISLIISDANVKRDKDKFVPL